MVCNTIVSELKSHMVLQSKYMRHWYSGIIIAFQAKDESSILSWRSKFYGSPSNITLSIVHDLIVLAGAERINKNSALGKMQIT